MTNWRQRSVIAIVVSVIAIVVEEGNVKIPGIWYGVQQYETAFTGE
ncbi:hypothetical protein M5J15_11665 [Serratia symbiotica]|nr:hypothetical protein [Serratia symbiotica]USS95225.1 hypothetical protein M5J15_11665 [Serratia symbiotica]